MTAPILKKYPRPNEPPPYPGRSVIVNYDIDDPLHWKNRLDKKLDYFGVGDFRPTTAAGSGNDPSLLSGPIRTSPVTSGAALTLAELKRKQLNRRQARLASGSSSAPESPTGLENYGVNSNEDGEESLENGQEEISLEERLKKLLEKDENEVSVDSAPTSPAPEPGPNATCNLQTGSQLSGNHSDNSPLLYAPQTSKGPSNPTFKSDQQQPPNKLTQLGASQSTQSTTHSSIDNPPSSSTPTIFSSNPHQKSADLPNPPNKSAQAKNDSAVTGGQTGRRSSLPRAASSSGTWAKPCSLEPRLVRAHSTMRTDILDVSFSEEDAESSLDDQSDQRPPSSETDEGFGGKHFCESEAGSSTEDLARKQLQIMYNMQMELLKEMRRDKGKLKSTNDGVVNPKYLPPRKRSDSVPESQMKERCDFLENHVASLARNLEHLTQELQYQQAVIRELNRSRQQFSPTYSTSRESTPVQPQQPVPHQVPHVHHQVHHQVPQQQPTPRLTKSVSFAKSHTTILPRDQSVPSVQPTNEPIVVSNPERVIKLTKFFGDEPPLVRLFLRKLGYEKYAPIFEREKIGSNELPYMTEDRLRRLGIPMGPRTRILQEAKRTLRGDPTESQHTSMHPGFEYNFV